MNRLQTAHSGAKAQSFTADNPRALLLRLSLANPQASQQELLDLCLAEIEDHPEFIEGIVEYWFINNYRMLRWERRGERPSRTMIDGIKAQIRLLDLMLPHGKTLGESTGTECVALGGWLSRIGKKVGEAVVSEVLSENDLRRSMADVPLPGLRPGRAPHPVAEQ